MTDRLHDAGSTDRRRTPQTHIAMPDHATTLSAADRHYLLGLARRTLREHNPSGQPPPVNEAVLSPALREPKACFVTLTRHGELRGCIGNLEPREPLFRAVMNNACGAAFRDTRFAPVAREEIPALEIEISVLTPPTPLAYDASAELMRQLRPGVDGVVLKVAGRTATFLPQVWEKIPEPSQFLGALAQKALLPASAWCDPGAMIFTYQVESFAEEPRAR